MIQLWRHARVRTEEFAESTCRLGLDADPMSHQVSHDRVDSMEHLYGMAYCAMPCLVLAVTKVKMNKVGIKSKHWRWSLTMGKDGNCYFFRILTKHAVLLSWKDRTQITQNTSIYD